MFKNIVLSVALASSLFASEKLFVVERENSSLAVIENDKFKSRIENFRNMNHGVVKFYKEEGYAISRDGYVIKFDPKSEKIEAEYKTLREKQTKKVDLLSMEEAKKRKPNLFD